MVLKSAFPEHPVTVLKDEHGNHMMVAGEPILLMGQHGHRHTICADSALMVFLCSMAYPSRWCDLQFILGSLRSVLSVVFNHMVTILYD